MTISFREVPGEDNSKLTGSGEPAFILRGSGKVNERNQSQPLIHPVIGVAYSDSASWATTGDGTYTYTYDPKNRLMTATKTGLAAVMMATIPVFMALSEIVFLRTQRLTIRLALALLIGLFFVAMVFLFPNGVLELVGRLRGIVGRGKKVGQ